MCFLAQAANLGLLSKLEKAGLTLKDVEKLLPLGEEATSDRSTASVYKTIPMLRHKNSGSQLF